MGTTQSTHTTSEIKELPPKEGPCSVSGRKESTVQDCVLVEPPMISTEEDDDLSLASSDEESDDDSDDEEGMCFWISM